MNAHFRKEVSNKLVAAQTQVDTLTKDLFWAVNRRDVLAKQNECDHPKGSLTVETMEFVETTCNKCGYSWMD